MQINGKSMDIENNITVEDLISKLNLNKDKLVVEVNLSIVYKDNYSTFHLNENDKVEIISFVGGG